MDPGRVLGGEGGSKGTSLARERVIGQRLVGVKTQAERGQASNANAHILAWSQGPYLRRDSK